MRKISKSRADDDGLSSTNGSVNNEEIPEKGARNGKSDDEEDTANDNDTGLDESETAAEQTVSKEPPKKRASRAKANKKKNKETAADTSEDEEYEVERIIDMKKVKGKLQYLIRWKGYSAANDTWEPEDTVSCPELVQKYHTEKGNSKGSGKKGSSLKNSKKRKATKKNNTPSKKVKKNEWDSENADENAEYEVERILEVHHKKNGKREFLIHWKGWSNNYDSWEPENNLNCPDLIKKFMDKVSVARSTDSRALRVAPESTQRFTLQDPTTGRRLSKRRGQRQRVRYDNAE